MGDGKTIHHGPVTKTDRNSAWGCWSSQALRSCWLPDHDLTARRDHLAD
jgi:hypothetical protein